MNLQDLVYQNATVIKRMTEKGIKTEKTVKLRKNPNIFQP